MIKALTLGLICFLVASTAFAEEIRVDQFDAKGRRTGYLIFAPAPNRSILRYSFASDKATARSRHRRRPTASHAGATTIRMAGRSRLNGGLGKFRIAILTPMSSTASLLERQGTTWVARDCVARSGHLYFLAALRRDELPERVSYAESGQQEG